ncbi:TlpA family protein disulfide reductase [Granulosicoccus sp. 3-233]|uniref:TlpA family protein disulfide reductase n=1 Tax=Granulosicoccus sp. 3-233 TaxID=3417969 RepID=UPI003D33ABF3
MRVSVWTGALSLSLALFASSTLAAEPLLDDVDRALPTFDLASVGDGQWQAERLLGKPWVINFWATWCPPCVEEIPSMNAAWQALESEGVGMLAINAGEGQEAVDAFLKKIPIDFPTLLGDVNSLNNWSVMALPTTLIVNSQGQVVHEALGPREWDDPVLLEKVLELRESTDDAASVETSN